MKTDPATETTVGTGYCRVMEQVLRRRAAAARSTETTQPAQHEEVRP